MPRAAARESEIVTQVAETGAGIRTPASHSSSSFAVIDRGGASGVADSIRMVHPAPSDNESANAQVPPRLIEPV